MVRLVPSLRSLEPIVFDDIHLQIFRKGQIRCSINKEHNANRMVPDRIDRDKQFGRRFRGV